MPTYLDPTVATQLKQAGISLKRNKGESVPDFLKRVNDEPIVKRFRETRGVTPPRGGAEVLSESTAAATKAADIQRKRAKGNGRSSTLLGDVLKPATAKPALSTIGPLAASMFGGRR